MDLQSEIRKVAYELYEKSGCMGGHEIENWLAAEKIVMARHAQKEKSGKAEPSSKTHPSKKASSGSKIKKAEAPRPASKDLESLKPRAKKTGAKKVTKTGK